MAMTSACQVDFYVLARTTQSAEQLACRLSMMAWEQGHRVAVCTGSERAAERLNELMWDDPPGRFLPHATGPDDGTAPVQILAGHGGITPHRDLVINLCPEAVPDPERFARLCEIVPADSAQRDASRVKFRTYRAGGLSPETHSME
ncbi:MAG: DNA polymerase III subunit chi [Xanthomonadales bacterium]